MGTARKKDVLELPFSFNKNRPFWKFSVLAASIIVLTLGYLFIRSTLTPKDYVYAQVKISQGSWWVVAQKPSIWFIQNLNAGEKQQTLLGGVDAEIIETRYYPFKSDAHKFETEYSIYVLARLSVETTGGRYIFNRKPIAVGSEINLAFPSVQFAGTIISLSPELPKDELTEKTIVLTKKLAYPWEYDMVKAGDTQFDGVDSVFEVTSKSFRDTYTLRQDVYGNTAYQSPERRIYLTVTGRIKVRQEDGNLIFGEEQILKPGSEIDLATDGFVFSQFYVADIR